MQPEEQINMVLAGPLPVRIIRDDASRDRLLDLCTEVDALNPGERASFMDIVLRTSCQHTRNVPRCPSLPTFVQLSSGAGLIVEVCR